MMASRSRIPVAKLAGVFCVFHGTSHKIAASIVRNGFVNVKRNEADLGFFASGIYTTPQATYAMKYAMNTLSGAAPVRRSLDCS